MNRNRWPVYAGMGGRFEPDSVAGLAGMRIDEADGRRKRFRPSPETVGHASQTLRDDLKRGQLQAIELLSYERDDELDEEGETELVSTMLTIKPRVPLTGNLALGVVERIKAYGRKRGYTIQKIRFKRTDRERQQTVPISTAREDAGDALYTRCETISVDQPLPQCSDTIRQDVVDQMAVLLEEARNGDG